MNFPAHECGLSLLHNVHRGAYQTAAEFIADMDDRPCPPYWQSEEAKQRAIVTGEIWEMQWYPNTPIGFCCVAAPTLEELLEYASQGHTP